MEPILKAINLTYAPVFDRFSIAFFPQKITAISGSNSCGKSLLVELLGGIHKTEESIVFHHVYLESYGQDLYTKIGIVLSSKKLPFLWDTVERELRFPLENMGLPEEKIVGRIDKVLEQFHLTKVKKKDPKKLDLFEQKKVSIALAVIHDPEVLLMDDPFRLFSKQQKEEMHAMFQEWKKEGMTILYTTDRLDDTIGSDFLYLMADGKVVLEGPTKEVLQQEKVIRRLGLKLPFCVDLSLKLKNYELLKEVVLDMDEMVNLLWK